MINCLDKLRCWITHTLYVEYAALHWIGILLTVKYFEYQFGEMWMDKGLFQQIHGHRKELKVWDLYLLRFCFSSMELRVSRFIRMVNMLYKIFNTLDNVVLWYLEFLNTKIILFWSLKGYKKNIITSPAQQFHQLFPTTFVQYVIAWII